MVVVVAPPSVMLRFPTPTVALGLTPTLSVNYDRLLHFSLLSAKGKSNTSYVSNEEKNVKWLLVSLGKHCYTVPP